MFSTPKGLLKHALRGILRRGAPAPQALPPETWGLEVGAEGGLRLDGVSLDAVGREHGFPAHVVNAERLRDNARRFLAVPPGCAKACEVFSSYKTNPVPGVLQQLHAVGLGAEVISHYEFWLARRLGVPPDRIVFNGPAKSEEAILEAIAADIALLNVNHREELAVVERAARQLQRRPRIGLRVSVGQAGTEQFGIPIEGGEALAAFGEALQSPHLNLVGIHAHRGRMIHSETELRSFAHAVLEFTDALHRRLGSALEILDFGGSLGTPTVRSLTAADLRVSRTLQREPSPPIVGSSLTIDRYVATLVGMVEEFHAGRRRSRPRIFIEPGRALTSDTQLLLASVVNLKRTSDRTFAILNAGINLAESCRSEYHQLLSVNRADRSPTELYTIVGPICTPGDTLYWTARLPPLEVGDSVAIMDAGAYFVPFSTAFSFPRPPILSVDRGSVSILRRAEQFEDLVAYDALPGAEPISPSSP